MGALQMCMRGSVEQTHMTSGGDALRPRCMCVRAPVCVCLCVCVRGVVLCVRTCVEMWDAFEWDLPLGVCACASHTQQPRVWREARTSRRRVCRVESEIR
jgi:hypothetical protein